MIIVDILTALQDENDIILRDRTFHPRTVEVAVLDTGENVYWAYGDVGVWLSVDPGGEEIVQFEDLDEELEPEDDVVVYGGDDYEFSYEGSATLKDDETSSMFTFREYENSNGKRIRLTTNEGNGDVTVSLGFIVTEEEVQEA
ncbi:MAG: hypothetical protein QX199_20190 [Methylococcaceae bacterium]